MNIAHPYCRHQIRSSLADDQSGQNCQNHLHKMSCPISCKPTFSFGRQIYALAKCLHCKACLFFSISWRNGTLKSYGVFLQLQFCLNNKACVCCIIDNESGGNPSPTLVSQVPQDTVSTEVVHVETGAQNKVLHYQWNICKTVVCLQLHLSNEACVCCIIESEG